MAIHDSGIPSPLPDSFKKFKPRDLRWLWSYLERYRRLDPTPNTPPPPYISLSQSVRIRMMADAIKQHEHPDEFVSTIISHHNDSLVPEEHLKWIDKENHRLLIWCLYHLCPRTSDHLYVHNQLPELLQRMPHPSTTFAVTRHGEIVAAIDVWSVSREEKILLLLEKKNEWTQYKTSEKQIKWLNPTDNDQLVWAWEYLEKQRKHLLIPKPADTNEYHGAVLAAFDELSYGHPSDKRLFMEQMKRTWSQKKFRDSGKAKKPYYLPLTIKTREKLEWLAENSGQKPAEILEQLIHEKYEKATKSE